MEWLWAILAIGASCAIWAIFVERQLFVIRRQTVAILPAGSKSIKLLHIADFHLAPWQQRKAKFITDLAALQPDLVIDTGDNLGHKNSVEPLLRCIDPLLKTQGAFVNGSNDYHTPTFRNPFSYLFHPSKPTRKERIETARMTDAFEQAGWKNLNNKNASVEINGIKISLTGVDDAHDGLADLNSIATHSNADFVIGVTHAPYLNVLERMTTAGANLIIAGHTHGGQVCLPFKGALVTNCDLPTHAAKGLSAWEFDGKTSVLNVCAGLGTSIMAPVRFFCRPEVRLLELVGSPDVSA